MQTHALHLPATARPRGPTPRRFGDHLDPRGHPRATIVHYGPTHTGPPTTASPSRAPGQPRARAPTLQTHALHSPATFRPRGSTPRRFGDQPDPRGHQAHHYAVYHYHGGGTTVRYGRVVAATTASPSRAPKQPPQPWHLPATARTRGSTPRRLPGTTHAGPRVPGAPWLRLCRKSVSLFSDPRSSFSDPVVNGVRHFRTLVV